MHQLEGLLNPWQFNRTSYRVHIIAECLPLPSCLPARLHLSLFLYNLYLDINTAVRWKPDRILLRLGSSSRSAYTATNAKRVISLSLSILPRTTLSFNYWMNFKDRDLKQVRCALERRYLFLLLYLYFGVSSKIGKTHIDYSTCGHNVGWIRIKENKKYGSWIS